MASKNVDNSEFQVATDQGRTYSTSQASKLLKRSTSMVKRYKITLLEAWGPNSSLVVNTAGSLTEQGLSELRIVQAFSQAGNPDGYKQDVRKRYSDLFEDLATDQGSDQVTGQVVDAEIVDFFPDGAETLEVLAIQKAQEGRELATANQTFATSLASAQGRLYATIRSAIDPVAQQAIRDSLVEATKAMSSLGEPTPGESEGT